MSEGRDLQRDAPLLRALFKHLERGLLPFHMPGHKQGRGVDREFFEFLGPNLFKMDLTELKGLDDLHAPSGPIREAQDLASQAFGADETFFLVNGTTAGIHAMIMATCGPGDEVILERDVHRSVVGATVLSGALPVFVDVYVEDSFGVPCGARVGQLERAIRQHPKARAIMVVNPNYYGIAPDLERIVHMAHSYGKIVLVDEAHGAHFRFHESLPRSALECGADACVHSVHKVLGSVTQSSMLHLKGSRVDRGRIRQALRLLQTTSPSYVLMASLDAARRHVAMRGGQLLERAVEAAEIARGALNAMGSVRCLSIEDIMSVAAEDLKNRDDITGASTRPRQEPCKGMARHFKDRDDITGVSREGLNGPGLALDPLKLTVSFQGAGLSGAEAAEVLRERHGIEVEFADLENVLAMLTLADGPEEAGRLVLAIETMVREPGSSLGNWGRYKERGCRRNLTGNNLNGGRVESGGLQGMGGRRQSELLKAALRLPPQRMSPREAFFSSRASVPLRDAVGAVCAEMVVLYPPGVALVWPGEEITEEVIEYIVAAREAGLRFQGAEERTLEELQVVLH